MNEHDQHIVDVAAERFERRLAEECGRLRVEMATGFGSLRGEMGGLRAEMIDRNAELLKWMLVFFALQLAAMTGLLTLFR